MNQFITKLNKRTKNNKGFTLIELIVVIAILGILAALAVPRLTGSRDSANRSAVLANLRTIESAFSIAEAEGKAITGIGTDTDEDTVMTLTGQDYLNKVPTGPTGVARYAVGTDGVATVTFSNVNNVFGFDVTGVGPHKLSDLE